MYYSGIDLHKDNCYITTLDEDGKIVSQLRVKNDEKQLINYFKLIGEEHKTVIEATNSWYWINDLLESNNIRVELAHAKYLKAIAYSKVKTDKLDSYTLSILLQNNLVSPSHKISVDKRGLRDTMRMRLRLVQKRTSCYNSIHRIAEKFNCDSEVDLNEELTPEGLPEDYKFQVKLLYEQIDILNKQIKELEINLRTRLLTNEDIQRLLWVPAIGMITAFSIYLEIDGIERFETVKKFLSYCRLVPGAKNSNKNIRHKSGNKEGNKYLKIAFSDAAVHAVRYYPEIRSHYQKILRRSNQSIARTVVAKEIAKIVYFILKNKTEYKGYKGKPISRMKSQSWPRLASPDFGLGK
jgi:transposase